MNNDNDSPEVELCFEVMQEEGWRKDCYAYNTAGKPMDDAIELMKRIPFPEWASAWFRVCWVSELRDYTKTCCVSALVKLEFSPLDPEDKHDRKELEEQRGYYFVYIFYHNLGPKFVIKRLGEGEEVLSGNWE